MSSLKRAYAGSLLHHAGELSARSKTAAAGALWGLLNEAASMQR
jgi:hypothetical protein